MKARIPLSAFRVAAGKVAITLSLHGVRCVTAVLQAGDIEPCLKRFEEGMDIEQVERADVSVHGQIRELLRRDLAKDENADMEACTASGLWLALNHPFGAETIRRDVSTSLLKQDRAQLTIASDDRGVWSFVVSDKPAEPEALMAMVPVGTNFCLTRPPSDDQPASH